MQLKMIELAAIEPCSTHGMDCNVVGNLAGIYIEKGDRRARGAGNLPILVEVTGPDSYRVIEGEIRVFAARIAAEQAPWIEQVNALVLDEWEVDSAGAQVAVERGEVWSPAVPAMDGSGHDETLEAVGGYDPEDED